MLTSFIETVVRDTGRDKSGNRVGFFDSLKNLGMVESRLDNNRLELGKFVPDPSCLKNIEAIRQHRNELLHDILNEDMPEEYIGGTIKGIIKELRFVYQESNLIRDYFRKKFGFDPKDEIS